MLRATLWGILFLLQFGGMAAEPRDSNRVELRFPEPVALSNEAQQDLKSQAISLVESSIHHTAWPYNFSQSPLHIHEAYREAVGGRYLLASFDPPRQITSGSGELEVAEIVVALNRDDYASGVFTIDRTGRITSHMRYDGTQAVALMATVQNIAGPGSEARVPLPNRAHMRAIAKRIAAGDAAAFDELCTTSEQLYRDIDHEKEHARTINNLVLMEAAMNILGEEAGKGNDVAFQALKKGLGVASVKAHVPTALGKAAAGGRREALDILLDHDAHGILESSVVFALHPAAGANLQPAVDYLVTVLESHDHRALWHGAKEGLALAAAKGNATAKAALAKHASPGE